MLLAARRFVGAALSICAVVMAPSVAAYAQDPVLTAPQLPSLEEAMAKCESTADPFAAIDHCTLMLAEPELRPRERMSALFYRAYAYDEVGEYYRAIDDLDELLDINPREGQAYRNRGIAFERLGLVDRAVNDWVREIETVGPRAAVWWQTYLSNNTSYYGGPIDGRISVELQAALVACARDPIC